MFLKFERAMASTNEIQNTSLYMLTKRFVLIANQCVYMQPGNRKICPQWRPSFFMTRTRYFIYGIFGISELFGCSVSENTLRATQSSSKRVHLVVSLRYVVGDKSAQTLAISTQHPKNSDCGRMATESLNSLVACCWTLHTPG